MSAKSLIMFVGVVVLAHTVIGCATMPKANAEEATLRITITATDDGEIRETVVGIKDGKEVSLEPVPIKDPKNPIQSIREMFPNKIVKGGNTPLILIITGSPACVCRYAGGGLLCQPQGCQ